MKYGSSCFYRYSHYYRFVGCYRYCRVCGVYRLYAGFISTAAMRNLRDIFDIPIFLISPPRPYSYPTFPYYPRISDPALIISIFPTLPTRTEQSYLALPYIPTYPCPTCLYHDHLDLLRFARSIRFIDSMQDLDL